jgi:hypothetical protein
MPAPQNLRVFGSVVVNGVEYSDDEISSLLGKKVGLFGIGWKYGGGRSFAESGIAVFDNVANNTVASFGGRKGLPDFLQWWSLAPTMPAPEPARNPLQRVKLLPRKEIQT